MRGKKDETAIMRTWASVPFLVVVLLCLGAVAGTSPEVVTPVLVPYEEEAHCLGNLSTSYEVLTVNLEEVMTPLSISLWLLFAGLAKIGKSLRI